MKTLRRGPLPQEGTRKIRLLVLVPHRDARLPLRAWSGALFAAGIHGAWSFPWVAPLAVLSRPFSSGELKQTACALREQSLAGRRDGKIKTGPAARASFPLGVFGGNAEDVAVFGPVLDIAVPGEMFSANAAGKITYRFYPLVFGSAFTRGTGLAGTKESAVLPPPEISFRAAALANMIFRPLPSGGNEPDGGYSFEWKIGRPHWLPPVKNIKRRPKPAGERE